MDDPIRIALLFALTHFEAMDRANAAIHCSDVRYSPITFRLAEAYDAYALNVGDWPEVVARVMHHNGAYAEDAGR